VRESHEFFDQLELNDAQRQIAHEVLKEIRTRLGFLADVGLHYLTLERNAPTLSGGEAQRIRLASQIGSGLTGVLYILDEPSIGLHQRDNRKLLHTLAQLRDLGNTVVVVEHDEETIRERLGRRLRAGRGQARRRGRLLRNAQAAGAIQTLADRQYLSGAKSIPLPGAAAIQAKSA